MDFIPKVEELIVEEEEPTEIIESKPTTIAQITEHDIFNEKPKLVIKEVIEDVNQEPEISPIVEEVKPVKKKRVLTAEHKAKLAEARVKALETRRRNSALKKEKKELEKTIKDKELEELRAKAGIRKPKPIVKKVVIDPVEEVFKEPEPEPVKEVKKQYYTQEDLETASLNAIMGYEKIRKTRKQKKAEELEASRHERELKAEITGRIIPQKASMYGQQNYWDNCY